MAITGFPKYDPTVEEGFSINGQTVLGADGRYYFKNGQPVTAQNGQFSIESGWTPNDSSSEGFNWDTALGWGKLGLQAAALPFQIYGGLQTVKLAKDQLRNAQAQFNWQKRVDTANMNNQIQTTNAANYDKAVARASGVGGTAAQQSAMANDVYNRYKLNENW